MHKNLVKYLTVFVLLLIFVNRVVFVAPHEIENKGFKEINSVVEWMTYLFTGENNDIDEDGNFQNDCNSAKTITFVFYQEFAHYLDLLSLYSKNIEKAVIPSEESIPQKEFYFQIDHPPQS